MNYDTAQPYIASYIILKNKQGQVAFVLRSNTKWMNGFYGLPAGKVEKDESFSACAIREAKEEVGVSIDPNDLRQTLTMHRYEKDQNDWVDLFFVATQWSGEPYNAEPNVHSELSWFGMNELPENIVPNVRDALEQIEKGITYREYNWEETA